MDNSIIIHDFIVRGSKGACWRAWTTNAGLCSFFSPNSSIDLRPGGAVEILFDMDAPKGSRGSEGMTVMSVEDGSMLTFTWNAPPSIPDIRGQRTFVMITFAAESNETTRVIFRNAGYGQNDNWRKTYSYFTRAWGEIVLPKFRYYIEVGPFDWNDLPDFSQYSLI